MQIQSIGFIGGGRITRIFLQAMQNKQFSLDQVFVSDSNPQVLARLQEQFPDIETSSDNALPASQKIIVIALHPPVIMGVLEEIKNKISENSILLSLAPKITIEKFKSVLKISSVARMIPNATSVINEGYNPICFSTDFDKNKKSDLFNWLDLLGTTFRVEENKLEAYALVSAMAPTYFWFQLKKLVEIGNEIGLEPGEAEQAVYQSIKAALHVQFDHGFSYENVIDLIPVKPIGEHEGEIGNIYDQKLKGLFEKISPY